MGGDTNGKEDNAEDEKDTGCSAFVEFHGSYFLGFTSAY